MNFLTKIKFLLRRPKVVIVTGNGRKEAKEAIGHVLRKHFKAGSEILLYETNLKDTEKYKFLISKSSLPVLVITYISEIPPDKKFYNEERGGIKEIRGLAKNLSVQTRLILNYDDEAVREIDNFTSLQTLKFGFSDRADIFASDVKSNERDASPSRGTGGPVLGTNFKINYKGYIVPIWLDKLFNKEQIYAALSAVSVGVIFGLNLIEISEALKDYQGLPRKKN